MNEAALALGMMARLMVIGFMGLSSLYDRIWGSTSQNLTRLSPCTVIIVK